MRSSFKISGICIVIILWVFTTRITNGQQGTGTVSTAYGKVSGVVENGVTYFKGVPYAKPPVGELRWAAPEDPEPWNGVLACDEYAPMAMQILSTTDLWGFEFYYDWYDKDPPMSEDCLYLNVVTPSLNPGQKYPVLVWFHGGASMHGYSWEPEFEPSKLVQKGIIVVSVGYRLGVFGYLATKPLSKASPTGTSGNYGLLDQIKSLEWVKENIAAFGGDPAKVTIAGQSAGAGAVANILTSPLAKGLYRGAILSWRTSFFDGSRTLAEVEESSMGYLKEKGYDKMSVKELRALPTEAFLNRNTDKREVYGKGFGACIDGYSLTMSGHDFFLAENALEGINLIFGSNSGDRNDGFRPMTREEVQNDAKRTYGALYEKYDFEKLYPAVDDIGATWEYYRLRSLQLSATNWVSAQVLSRLNPKSKFFQEYFNRWPPGRESELRRSFHSSDLWYTFYSLRDIPEQREWEPVDHQVADTYSSYWANFVANGDPNGGSLPYWPNANKDLPVFMEIGNQCILKSNFYEGTKYAERDDFMREYTITRYGLQEFLK